MCGYVEYGPSARQHRIVMWHEAVHGIEVLSNVVLNHTTCKRYRDYSS